MKTEEIRLDEELSICHVYYWGIEYTYGSDSWRYNDEELDAEKSQHLKFSDCDK